MPTEQGPKILWYVEMDGQRIAGLAEPRFAEMFWTSFVLIPLTSDPALLARLYTDEFWDLCEGIPLVFRFAVSGEVAPFAFPSLSAAQTLKESGRISMRGLYTESDIAEMKRARERPEEDDELCFFRTLWLSFGRWWRKKLARTHRS